MYRIPVRSSSWGARRPLSTPQTPADRPSRGGPEGNAPAPDMRWPSLTRPGPSRIPVVGPTQAVAGRGEAPFRTDIPGSTVPPAPAQARRERDRGPGPHGRAGRPGMHLPPGTVPGLPGHERQSGWQLAQRVWQESGVDWENVPGAAEGDPYAAPDPYSAAAFTVHPHVPVPADSGLGMGPWPMQDPPVPPEPDPALDGQAPEGPAAPVTPPDPTEPPGPGDPTEPAESGTPGEPEAPEDSAGSGEHQEREASGAPRWNGDRRVVLGRPRPADRDQAARRRPAFTPAASGPAAFTPPTFTPAAPDPAAFTSAGSGPAVSPPFAERRPPLEPRWPTTVRSFSAPPLSAPVAPSAPPLAESDELFRAWQGSVREATARPAPWADRRPAPAPAPATDRPSRRGRGRQVAKIGVPAAVIVTVGAGALLMLTGRANEVLAERADTGALASATPGVSASLSPASTPLAGYPGEHGTVGVAAMWSAAGLTVAVGYADGHPAVWRHAADGSWSLVSAASLGGLPGHLTAVAEGSLGWIAVGSVSENGTVEPMVYRSADGTTWTPVPSLTALAGSGAQFLGVAAGPGGYLVVGKTGSGKQASAAMWWSADLANWVSGANSGSAGSFATSAVAVDDGFIAVGSENNCHTIWTSLNGRQWTGHDLAKPAGAHLATLLSVAASSAGHIVAAGYAVNSAGDMPIVVVSTDGGAHTTQIVLNSPDGPASVTAVTATSDGFVAAGRAGPASAQRAVTWTSPDGLTWSAATPLTSAGSGAVTALADTSTAGAATVAGTAQHGASADLLTVPAP
jgi:hypothetical protein